jgi:ubiquinone/menaquinone biosynthesis C-methylase UbiE
MSRLVKLYLKWDKKKDRQFLNMLEYNPDFKVVDLGCGKGDFTLKVKEVINCPEICDADSWENGLKESHNKGIKAEKVDLNGTLNLFDDSFHVIVSNQVIEHLFYPSKFIKEIQST